MDDLRSDSNTRDFQEAHQLYDAYVRAARDYFERSTVHHWDKKEEAFERYTECIEHAKKQDGSC